MLALISSTEKFGISETERVVRVLGRKVTEDHRRCKSTGIKAQQRRKIANSMGDCIQRSNSFPNFFRHLVFLSFL